MAFNMWKRYAFIGGDERSLHHLLARRDPGAGWVPGGFAVAAEALASAGQRRARHRRLSRWSALQVHRRR